MFGLHLRLHLLTYSVYRFRTTCGDDLGFNLSGLGLIPIILIGFIECAFHATRDCRVVLLERRLCWAGGFLNRAWYVRHRAVRVGKHRDTCRVFSLKRTAGATLPWRRRRLWSGVTIRATLTMALRTDPSARRCVWGYLVRGAPTVHLPQDWAMWWGR